MEMVLASSGWTQERGHIAAMVSARSAPDKGRSPSMRLTRSSVNGSLVDKGVDVIQQSQTGLDSGLTSGGRQRVSVELLTDAACEARRNGSTHGYIQLSAKSRLTDLVMISVESVEDSQPSPSSQQSLGTISTEPTGIGTNDGRSKGSKLQVLANDLDVLFPSTSRVTQPVPVMPAGTTETRSSDDEGLLAGFPGELGLSGGETVHGSVQVVFVVGSSAIVLNDVGSGAEVTDVLQSGPVRVLSGRGSSSVLDSAGVVTDSLSDYPPSLSKARPNSLRGVQPLRVERRVLGIGHGSIGILLLSNPVVMVRSRQVPLGSSVVAIAERSRHVGSDLEGFETLDGGTEDSGEVSGRRNFSFFGDSNGVGLEVGQEIGRFCKRNRQDVSLVVLLQTGGGCRFH